MGISLAAAQRTFEVEFAEWLELSQAYIEPSEFPDALAHERAMDTLYERRVRIEAWLSAYSPTNPMEALCLIEVVHFHDELEDVSARTLDHVQQWLARGLVGEIPALPIAVAPLVRRRASPADHPGR